jgi:hypothetical protein
MKRKPKREHRANGEMFEYAGRFYRAMLIEDGELNVCSMCAFGKPKSNDDYRAHGCKDHVCELENERVFFEEVKSSPIKETPISEWKESNL